MIGYSWLRPSVVRERGARAATFWVLAVVSACIANGCVYDPDKRCGEERRLERGMCVCPTGTIDKDGRCLEQEKPPRDAGARPVLDAAADGAQTCNEHSDCDEGFFCPMAANGGHCAPLPTGEGEACTSQDECAGFEASYCTIGDPRGSACAVPDCEIDGCSQGRECLDFSNYVPGTPPLCVEPFQ